MNQRSASFVATGWLGLMLLGGCDPVSASDAGSDAGALDTPLDVASPPIDAPVCDAAPAPADLPALTGTFVVLNPDAGSSLPVLTGGDPVGVWRFSEATIYSPPETEGMFDTATSTISGTAWVVVEGNNVRMELNLDISLVTTIAGTIRRVSRTTLVGTYTVDGTTLDVSVACVEPLPTGASGFAPGFSVAGEQGVLAFEMMGMVGTNLIVLTGSRTAN